MTIDIIRKLALVANQLDKAGLFKRANEVDSVLSSMVEGNSGSNNGGSAKDLMREVIEGAEENGYLSRILSQRNPSSSSRAGSFFLEDQTAESLKSADWQPFAHPAISPPAIGFRASIPGTVGMVELSKLPPGTMVMATDPKRTHGTKGGGYSVEVLMDSDNLPESDYTTALVGPGEKGETHVLWTIFPGSPNGASIVGTHDLAPIKPPNSDDFRVWEEIPVSEAIESGFKFGKVVSNYSDEPQDEPQDKPEDSFSLPESEDSFPEDDEPFPEEEESYPEWDDDDSL